MSMLTLLQTKVCPSKKPERFQVDVVRTGVANWCQLVQDLITTDMQSRQEIFACFSRVRYP